MLPLNLCLKNWEYEHDIVVSSAFKKDLKKLKGKDTGKLKEIIGLLSDGLPIPAVYRDHALTGQWKGYRDAHIEPDFLLIYRVDENSVYLARTGSHSEIFR